MRLALGAGTSTRGLEAVPVAVETRRALPDSYSEFQTHTNSQSELESREGASECNFALLECRYLFFGRPDARFTSWSSSSSTARLPVRIASIPNVVHF